MKLKKALLPVILGAMIVASASLAYAGGHEGGKKDCMKGKFFKKIHMIYAYQDELGLSDEQMDKIKELKISLKKDLINLKAEKKLLKVDIKSKMYDDPIDVEAVNKLVDQKYGVKAKKAKKVVKAFADLKKILTQEQKDMMMKMKRDKMKSGCCSKSGKGSSKGSMK